MQKISIAKFVIAVLITVATLVLTVSGILNYRVIKNEHWARLRVEHQVKTSQLAEGIALSLWNFDEPQIDKIMESYMNDEVVSGILISGSLKEHVMVRDEHWAITKGDDEFTGQDWLSEERSIMYNDEIIGKVKLFITPKFINRDMRDHLISTIIMIVLTDLILILVLYLLLWKIVLIPLQRVEQYAKAVSSGSETCLSAAFFGGELESLYLSIEKMVSQLQLRLKELQQSEQRFKVLVDHAPEAIAVYDYDQDRFVGANKNAEQLFGFSNQELLNSNPARFYASSQPDGLPVDVSIKKHTERALAGEALLFERIVHNAKGKDLHCEVRLVRLPSTDRQLLRVSYIDITQRKEAERLLLENQAHLQTLVQTIPDLIWLKDPDGVYLDCNAMFEKFFGAKKDDIIGKTDYDFVNRELAEFFRENDKKAIINGRPSRNEEWITFADDGHRALLDTVKTPMFDATGQLIGVLGIGRDITSRKRAEEENAKLQIQLSQSQKMEAIGTLAGGIAHDFNNILSVIIGYTDLAMLGELSENKNLEQVLTAAKRAKELVMQILAFSRQSQVEPIPLKIQPIINEGLKMLRSSIPTTISITQDISPNCGLIIADPTQIHQILMNLCTNAYHAMEDGGGTLSVSLQTAFVDPDSQKELLDVRAGEYVLLTVKDTGTGIKPGILGKMFDPYFTTKERDKGTGMGLAIIHGIIKEYGGAIDVESYIGEGTVFKVYFPVAEMNIELDTTDTEKLPEGKEQILFIDDEEVLAEMGKEMLESLGYHVTVKWNSIEALTTFQNTPNKFDMVITDQTMPYMTGADLARRMLQIRPDIPIILCTGYSNLIDESSAKAMGIKEFVFKPLSRESLAKLIRNVLDKR